MIGDVIDVPQPAPLTWEVRDPTAPPVDLTRHPADRAPQTMRVPAIPAVLATARTRGDRHVDTDAAAADYAWFSDIATAFYTLIPEAWAEDHLVDHMTTDLWRRLTLDAAAAGFGLVGPRRLTYHLAQAVPATAEQARKGHQVPRTWRSRSLLNSWDKVTILAACPIRPLITEGPS